MSDEPKYPTKVWWNHYEPAANPRYGRPPINRLFSRRQHATNSNYHWRRRGWNVTTFEGTIVWSPDV